MHDMSPAEAIFFSALEKETPAELAAYLDEACLGQPEVRSRVERMLAAFPRVGSFLEEKSSSVGAGSETPPKPRRDLTDSSQCGVEDPQNAYRHTEWVAGRMIAGKYKLLRRIGEGGMGTVLMADQVEPSGGELQSS